jgi:hypothetical protein
MAALLMRRLPEEFGTEMRSESMSFFEDGCDTRILRVIHKRNLLLGARTSSSAMSAQRERTCAIKPGRLSVAQREPRIWSAPAKRSDDGALDRHLRMAELQAWHQDRSILSC